MPLLSMEADPRLAWITMSAAGSVSRFLRKLSLTSLLMRLRPTAPGMDLRDTLMPSRALS